MKDIMISMFINRLSIVPIQISLEEWLTNDAGKHQVEVIRKIEDKDERKVLKDMLPCATISGLFSVRNTQGLIKHSGFICIDIDGQDNPGITDFEDLRDQLSHIINVAYASLSVSGRGVFCLIPILYSEKHKEHFEAFKADFLKIGIKIDPACSDICRLRFYSYDENAYFNSNAVVYSTLIERKSKALPKSASRKNFTKKFSSPDDTLKKVLTTIEKIESTGIDITGDYLQWFHIGCSLASEFGEDGREMFQTVSQFSGKYNEQYTDTQFEKCLGGKYSFDIGTFFYYAKEEGVI